MRATAIERRHHPRLRIGEMRHHPLQVARRNSDVRIVDEQEVIARVGCKLRKRAHLAIRSQPRRAFNQLDRESGELQLQLFHGRNGWVVERRSAEQQFIFARVILPAVAAEGIHHAGVEALQRFENADARGKRRDGRAPLCDEDARRKNGGEKVAHPGHGQHRGHNLHGLSENVRHHSSKSKRQRTVISCQWSVPRCQYEHATDL